MVETSARHTHNILFKIKGRQILLNVSGFASQLIFICMCQTVAADTNCGLPAVNSTWCFIKLNNKKRGHFPALVVFLVTFWIKCRLYIYQWMLKKTSPMSVCNRKYLILSCYLPVKCLFWISSIRFCEDRIVRDKNIFANTI